MLTFSRHSHPVKAIVIDGSSTLLGDDITVENFWPGSGTTRDMLLQTITRSLNTPARTLDTALAAVAGSTDHHRPLYHFEFSHQEGMGGVLWHAGADYQLVVKGAPERILQRCDLTENEREAAQLHVKKLSRNGASVVAIASAHLTKPVHALTEVSPAQRLTFIGFASFTSSIPGSLRQLIRRAQHRGVVIYLITGAHQQTAFAIAKQLGIAAHPNDVRDARQLHVTPTATQAVTVFARALPEDKTHIMTSLRTMNDDVVVVTTKEELTAALQ